MRNRQIEVLRRGVEAGIVAGVPQVLIAKIEERLLLPRSDDVDLGPRLIERLGEVLHRRLREDEKWIGASAFHFGYAAFWGALYAWLYERKPVHPALGGALLSSVIYLITFPRWGGAVLTRAERKPKRRSWRKGFVLVSAATTFGMCTGLLYGRGPGRRLW